MHSNYKKIMLFVFVIILVFGIYYFDLFMYFRSENLVRLKDFIQSYGLLGILVFSSIYIIGTIVGAPTAGLTIAAGLFFGLKVGYALVVVNATIAAYIAFYISRHFANKYMFSQDQEHKKETEGIVYKIKNTISKNSKKNGFYSIALLRLLFLPYIPVSYAAGLVKTLSARDFILATFVTNLFGSFVFIFLGSSLLENWYYFVIAIIMLLLFMQTPKIIKKFQKDSN